MHAEGLAESDVAPICEWSDNQPLGTTKEFVLVGKVNVSNRNDTGVHFFVEVGTSLFGPFEVVGWFDALFDLISFVRSLVINWDVW